jgi:nucleobase:cation symporter-1, NCS1 family
MASVTERLERALEREAPTWGIRPVPPEHRRLSGLDFGVLWGDLSIGLLVLVTGALLVPALGLPQALLAVVLGSVIGCLPLALMAVAGAREGVPGMVLFRPVLGRRGSFLPSFLNLVQLLGWTAFEFWAMATVANEVSVRLFGLDAYLLWLVLVSLVATTLALGGPILVVRRWLERFAVYVVAAVAGYLTVRVLSIGDLGALWSRPGTGGLPFGLAVDLVIVMPLSWLPLVADYNRFARPGVSSFRGTYLGYLAGNVWFYALGALLVLAAGAAATVQGIGAAIAALGGGSVVLLVLLVGESDQAFANIYSSAVTIQNVVPRARQRALIVAVAMVAFVAAWFLSMDTYEFFLFLIGSVFVPLFGVFAAHYFVLRAGRFGEAGLFHPGREVAGGVNWRALAPWTAGFAVYQWCVPTGPAGWVEAVQTFYSDWLRLPFPLLGSRIGASAPAFAVAFALSLLLRRRIRQTRAPISRSPSVGAAEGQPP